MKKILLLCLLSLSFAMAAKKSVAVFPCWGDLNDKELKQLRFKIETIGENTLLQSGGFKFIQHDLLDKGIDNKKVYIACKEGGTCVGDLTRDANADYGTWCQVEKSGGKLILYFQLFDNEENSNLYTNMFRDLKNIDDVLKIIDNEIPIAFKRMLPKEPKTIPPKPTPTVATKPPVTDPTPAPTPVTPTKRYSPPPPPIPKEVTPEFDDEYEKYRKNLYERNNERNRKKYAAAYALLNFPFSFGLGSYLQGDTKSGVVQSIADGIGWIFVAIDEDKAQREKRSNKGETGFAICLLAGWGYGLIAPFYHQYTYNKLYSIDPLIIPRDGAPAVGLAFNLRY